MIPWSTRAQIVYRRSYSRPLNEDSTEFEQWHQTIERVIRHQAWLWERAKGMNLDKKEREELDELKQLMLERKGYVSGRTLWLGGTEISRTRESCNFNCSNLSIKTVFDVVDALWLLLQGAGVGFTPITGILNGFIKPIPEIEVIRSTRTFKGGAERNTETWLSDSKTWILQVGDSAKAWAKAVGKLVAGKYPAKRLVLDLSQIRPAGERLRGYGWISSGDDQLSKALLGICSVLNKAAGRLLTEIDILDVMNWLGSVLSSRRSAELALLPHSSKHWREFAVAKKDHFDHNPQRSQSNNSLVLYEKPSKSQLFEIFDLMLESGGSEPGLVNGEAALRRAPYFRGLNPCLSAETLVLIPGQGLVRISSLAGLVVDVVDGNGDIVSARFEKTSDSEPLLEIELSNGLLLYATKYHRFVKVDDTFVLANELQLGDQLAVANIEGIFGTVHDPDNAYLDAWLIADGTYYGSKYNSKLGIHPNTPKINSIPELKRVGLVEFDSQHKDGVWRARILDHAIPDKTRVPDYVLKGDFDTVLAFVRGYLESDGHLGGSEKKGWLIQFASIHRTFLMEFYQLCRLLGLRGKISLFKQGGEYELPNGHGDLSFYHCQDCYRLTISNPTKLLQYIQPEMIKKGPYAKQEKVTVVSVEQSNRVEPVYCAGVPTTNSFTLGSVISGNCSEVLLGDHSFCNLVEIVTPRFNDNFVGLLRATYLLARANYRQTCVNLDDGVLQRTWHELNEYLHLCGVGLTGVVEWDRYQDRDALRALREVAREGADSMADELDLPRAANVTVVKPSGTLSKMSDCTEGVHKPLGKYIFNNINFSKHDPLVKILTDANYRIFENPYDTTGVVVTFPTQYDNVAFTQVDGRWVNTESAIEQLERYKLLMDHYVDNNVSITVSYSPGEVGKIVDWLHTNWDHYVACAFMFRNDPTKTAEDMGYPYLPQEVVTEEKYRAYVETLKPVMLELESVAGEFEMDAQECRSGMCPIK